MKDLLVEDNMSNLTSASNEASISSSNRNEIGTMYPQQQQSFASPSNQTQPPKKKRNLPGNPDPDAEVIALSPRSLMATNRFICEICNKGFQRDQNLQLHRRGHNLPWKLKQRTNKEVIRKKVYVCPEPTCVHHDPSRALGDLTGIKKHFCRKHGEKKWKCDKCSKRYAVQSDWKAHSKICGTREYRCDCGNLFSRRDSFITHRAFCDALTEESARSLTPNPLLSSQQPGPSTAHLIHTHALQQAFPLKREQPEIGNIPSWLACPPVVEAAAGPGPPAHHHHHHHLSSQLFSSSRFDDHQSPNPTNNNNIPTLHSFPSTASPHMSATALLQKAAQMGVTMSKTCPSEATLRPHQGHVTTSTAGSGLGLSSRDKEMPTDGLVHDLGSFGNTTTNNNNPNSLLVVHDMIMSGSLPSSTTGFEGSSSSPFDEDQNFINNNVGMLNHPKRDGNFQETVVPKLPAVGDAHLSRSKELGGGNDSLTRDFLGLRAFPHNHRDFLTIAGLDHLTSSSSSSYDHHQLNHNLHQSPWQG